MMTPGQVSCQIATEQVSIASGNDDAHSLSEHSVNEQLPAFDILHLVKKQVFKIAIESI